MNGRRLGVAAFLTLATLAAAGGPTTQLIFAGGAILTFGMLHGASDLAVAPRRCRPALMATYGAGVVVTLLWWRVAPFTALLAFLILSGVHFGTDDAPPERPGERWCRGVLMIGAPALLHRATLAGLFEALTGAAGASALLADGLAVAAAGALALLPVLARRPRGVPDDRGELAVGIAALVLLPPLVGFAVAFTLLHARPQLIERMRALRCERLPDYLRRTAPVLAGATAVVAGAAMLFIDGPAPALSTVFAALAALATPHMLAPAQWRAGEATATPAISQLRAVAD